MLKLCGKVILNMLYNNNNKMGKIINIVQFKYQGLYVLWLKHLNTIL